MIIVPNTLEEYSFPEIETMRYGIARIYENIRNSGIKYDYIIGDDTGGRLPTMVFRKLLKDLYGKSPETYFVLSPNKIGRDRVLDRFGEINRFHKEKTSASLSESIGLIVTQVIYNGVTTQYMSTGLKSLGVAAGNVDYAALHDDCSSSGKSSFFHYLKGAGYFVYPDNSHTKFSGVRSDGLPGAPIIGLHAMKNSNTSQQNINRARMDSERLVDQILSGYIDPPLFYSLDACVRYFLKKYSIGDSIQLSTLPKWVQSMIPIELLNKLKIDIDTIITSKYKQSDLSYELSLINEKPST